MAEGPESNDWRSHRLDSVSNFAGHAVEEVWTKAQSMSTGEWLAVGAVATVGIGAAGFTALRAAGLIGRGLTGATETALGVSGMSASGMAVSEDTIAAIARVTSRPSSLLSDSSMFAGNSSSALGDGLLSKRSATLTDLLSGKPASALSDTSFSTDPKLAKLFGPERTMVDLEKDNLVTFDPFRKSLTITEPRTKVGLYQSSRLPELQQMSQAASIGLGNYRRGIQIQTNLGNVGRSTQIARLTSENEIRDVVIRPDLNMAFEEVSVIKPGRTQFERAERRQFSFEDKTVRIWSETPEGTIRTTVGGSGSVSGRLLNESDALAELAPIKSKYLYNSAEGDSLTGLFGRLTGI